MKSTVGELVLSLLFPIVFGGLYYLFPAQDIQSRLIDSILFTVGAYGGVALLFLDSSFFAKKYAEQGVTGNVLITRSVVFVGTLVPLSIYMLTSTGSSVGIGLLFGILTVLVLEMLRLYKNTAAFNQRFLFQLREPFSQQQINYFIFALVLYWFFFTIGIFIVGETFSYFTGTLPF
jgi:hypothetical protein